LRCVDGCSEQGEKDPTPATAAELSSLLQSTHLLKTLLEGWTFLNFEVRPCLFVGSV
jgi:hypothetical protein